MLFYIKVLIIINSWIKSKQTKIFDRKYMKSYKKTSTSNEMSHDQLISFFKGNINSTIYNEKVITGQQVGNVIRSLEKLRDEERRRTQMMGPDGGQSGGLGLVDGKVEEETKTTKVKSPNSNSKPHPLPPLMPLHQQPFAQSPILQLRTVNQKLESLYTYLSRPPPIFNQQEYHKRQQQFTQQSKNELSVCHIIMEDFEKVLFARNSLVDLLGQEHNLGGRVTENEGVCGELLSIISKLQKQVVDRIDKIKDMEPIRNQNDKDKHKSANTLPLLFQMYDQYITLKQKQVKNLQQRIQASKKSQIPPPSPPYSSKSIEKHPPMPGTHGQSKQKSKKMPSSTNLSQTRLKKKQSINHNISTQNSQISSNIYSSEQIMIQTKKIKSKNINSFAFVTDQQELLKESQAIISIKQVYAKLFYKETKNIWFPSLKKLQIHIFNKKEEQLFRNRINHGGKTDEYKNRIVITIVGDSRSETNPDYDQKNDSGHSVIRIQLFTKSQNKTVQKQLTYKTIPNSQTNSTKSAKYLLQKKFWIKLSAALDQISFHFGDLTQADDKDVLRCRLGEQTRDSWENQATVFQSVNKDYQQNLFGFQCLNAFHLMFEVQDKAQLQQNMLNMYQQVSDKTYKRFIDQFFIVKPICITKILGSVLAVNPSVLTNHANIHILDKQIRVLYQYLKDLSVTCLPSFVHNKNSKIHLAEYLGWRSLRNAIDKSIKTQPGYLCYLLNGQKIEQPVGILNMLMQVKTIDISTLSLKGSFKWTQFKWDKQNLQEKMEEIYRYRRCYIRFQMTERQGISPGGMAVLQIWPPYCCSTVHNHGQAYGLIKVISNQICVQNYRDLNFIAEDQIPYQTNVYQQGEYTWMSGLSYGVHRLINTTSHTSINIQAYLNDKSSKQHFKLFVNRKLPKADQLNSQYSKKIYTQYFPQNDWKNFLRWPQDLAKKNPSPQKHKNMFKISEYIQKMKRFYEIEEGTFQEFAIIMKRQFEIYDYLSRELGNNGVVVWKGLAFEEEE